MIKRLNTGLTLICRHWRCGLTRTAITTPRRSEVKGRLRIIPLQGAGPLFVVVTVHVRLAADLRAAVVRTSVNTS